MDITLEQAKAFEAVARHKTVQKAAKSLNKGHSSILYLIKSLESQLQLELFDRSNYRNKVSPEGDVVLKYCKQLINTEEELIQACKKLQTGWEPSLKLVYDGVVDFNMIAGALFKLNESQIPTEIKVLSAYLHEVEDLSKVENADIMVTILPISQHGMSHINLKPLKMFLVCHKSHALSKKSDISPEILQNHTYIKIKGDYKNLGLSTEQIEFKSSFFVNDFVTKKQALTKGLGYGWLPEYLITQELQAGDIKILKTIFDNHYTLTPKLYHRKEELIGKTTQELLKNFKKTL